MYSKEYFYARKKYIANISEVGIDILGSEGSQFLLIDKFKKSE